MLDWRSLAFTDLVWIQFHKDRGSHSFLSLVLCFWKYGVGSIRFACYIDKNLSNLKELTMQYIGLLAPIAFVFSLAALAQIGALKKEISQLKEELQSKK